MKSQILFDLLQADSCHIFILLLMLQHIAKPFHPALFKQELRINYQVFA